MNSKDINNIFEFINESQVVEIGSTTQEFCDIVAKTQDHIQMIMSFSEVIEANSKATEDTYNHAFFNDTSYIPFKHNLTKAKEIIETITSHSDWIVEDYLDETNQHFIREDEENKLIQNETRICFIQPELQANKQNIIETYKKILEHLPKTLVISHNTQAQEIFSQLLETNVSIETQLNPVKPVIFRTGDYYALITGGYIR